MGAAPPDALTPSLLLVLLLLLLLLPDGEKTDGALLAKGGMGAAPDLLPPLPLLLLLPAA